MSALHAYFHLRKQEEFQKCLEHSKAACSTSSSSGQGINVGSNSGPSRSLTKIPVLGPKSVDVNARDSLGRTVLHLACSAVDPMALEFIRLLLAHPQINVNLQDAESSWSALHRALYAGNVPAAVLLLQRNDTERYLKDTEGYTPFDVYNSTVDGTNPPDIGDSEPHAELYTWGSNRNATLGLGDGDDRMYPEQVIVRRNDYTAGQLFDRLKPVPITDVYMSKTHTTILTAESKSNIRTCGFLSGGHVARGQSAHSQMQYSFINPQETFPHKLISLALGQDHTLAVTSAGEVLSWGFNRFAQLGYAIEGTGKAVDNQVQATPRKVTGPLRNQRVLGVACCKTASACWTATQLFTWGTNGGQLGYDISHLYVDKEKVAQPQVLPRPVATVTEPVAGVAMTDSAMLVLLKNGDVLCFLDESYWKLPFALPKTQRHFLSLKSGIRKVTTSGGNTSQFALISNMGDVFLFSTEDYFISKRDGKPIRPIPQLVWAVRRQFTAVKDVALATDGSMILCTKSGHVFIRSRAMKTSLLHGPRNSSSAAKGASAFKFHRVSSLQRVIRVFTNGAGDFAALRLNSIPESILLARHTLADDLEDALPFRWKLPTTSIGLQTQKEEAIRQSVPLISNQNVDDEEGPDVDIAHDLRAAMDICDYLQLGTNAPEPPEALGTLPNLASKLGADVFFKVGKLTIPAHKTIVQTRAPKLIEALRGGKLQLHNSRYGSTITFDGTSTKRGSKVSTVMVRGCQPAVILLLCYYLYCDRVVALWERRISLTISVHYISLKLNVATIQQELITLASQDMLNLTNLEASAQRVGLVAPHPTLVIDCARLMVSNTDTTHDVVLLLQDRQVHAHSIVLRARSSYFATFFDRDCWTSERAASNHGIITVDLKEFNYRPMSYLLRYLYEDVGVEAFSHLDFIQSTEQLTQFMFELISCSNFLLMDRYTDICSSYILRYIDSQNVASILVDAMHFNAQRLVQRIHGYMAGNLETLLDQNALDSLPDYAIGGFAHNLRLRQTALQPFMRSGGNLAKLEKRWESWLALQDFPSIIVPTHRIAPLRSTSTTVIPPPVHSPTTEAPYTARLLANRSTVSQETADLFAMDTDFAASSSLTKSCLASEAPRWWKESKTEKVDMKSIMEAEQQAADSRRTAQANKKYQPPALRPSSSISAGTMSKDIPSPGPRVAPTALQSTSKSSVGGFTPHSSNEKPWSLPGAAPSSTPPRSTGSPWATPDATPSKGRPSPITKQISANTAPPTQQLSKAAPSTSQSGPLIIPSKAPGLAAPMRKKASADGSAWASPPQPRMDKREGRKNPSFLEIQEQQASMPLPKGPPKSLKQIQEEEQEAAREAAFLSWFEAESARVQQQNAQVDAKTLQGNGQRENVSRRGKSGEGKRGRGGTRGKGRGGHLGPRVAQVHVD